MTIILHGENAIKSRDRLVEIINQSKANGQTIVSLEAKKLEPNQLEEALAKTSLFGNEEIILIEELHSLPKSKKKNQLIDLVANTNRGLILWEKRSLTKTMLKKFPQAKIEEFKLSNSLFSWLDVFHPKTPVKQNLLALNKAIATNGDYMCYVMLIRQISLLIYVKDGGSPPGAPFMISKLKKQAQYFSLDKLLAIHQQLFILDQKTKSSKNYLNMAQELDVLTVNLYS